MSTRERRGTATFDEAAQEQRRQTLCSREPVAGRSAKSAAQLAAARAGTTVQRQFQYKICHAGALGCPPTWHPRGGCLAGRGKSLSAQPKRRRWMGLFAAGTGAIAAH